MCMRIDDKLYLLNGENGTPIKSCAFLFKLNMEGFNATVTNESMKVFVLAQSGFKDKVPEVIMPCGSKVKYNTIFDIPNEDIPCPCGNPNHWLVKYER